MYYEVYLDFYFLESFLTDVALLILVKTVMREKWKAKRIAGTAVLESMWSCIELLLPFRGSFTATFFWIVSILLLVRGGLGKSSMVHCCLEFQAFALAVHCMWQKRSDIFREFL